MNELTKVYLENEMDLILAHKQSMRVAELAGLPLSAQTTLATAVSEIARNAIGVKNEATLTLYVSDKKEKLKYITAVLEDKRQGFSQSSDDGYKYARRLVQHIECTTIAGANRIELHYRLPQTLRIDDAILEKWRININTDPAISPYEEIKRKNRELIEMADRLRNSEQQYKSLTDSLPIMIFSMNTEGRLTYMNQWLYDYSGQTIEEINDSRWGNVVHADDFDEMWRNWAKVVTNADAIVTPERRLRNAATGEYRWHTGVSIAIKGEDGQVKSWNSFLVDIHAQKLIEETLKDNRLLKELHTELEEKIDQLNHSNQQLEQFAYVASHDLQEPLRKIGFYSDFINKKYAALLPEEAGMFFNNLMNATERMKVLIKDILSYSTVQHEPFTGVELSDVAQDSLSDLEISINEREALISVGQLPRVEGNARQLKQLFENLISNSLKFAHKDRQLHIAIAAEVVNNQVLLSFTDNGIGFDQAYIHKMFDIFQRLHGREKYSGTGIGLAICKKIVQMHNGTITAHGKQNEGAIFLITLPLTQSELVHVH